MKQFTKAFRQIYFLALAFGFCLLLPSMLSAQDTSEKIKNYRAYQQFALRHAGVPENGRKLFDDAKRTQCAICHIIAGKGGGVGVDLSNIGGKFDRPHLIESLLEPSRQIVEGYRTTCIATTDGKVLCGILKQQSQQQITLADATGKLHVIQRDDIEELSESSVSIMPEGLAKELSLEEFTDLIAYLENLRSGGRKTAGDSTAGPISLPAEFELQTIVTGLDGAVALDVLPDGRILICEQPGRVRVIQEDKLLEEPFVTLPVEAFWERGVIGVTHDPDFPRQPYIYVCWVAKAPYPHHRISRFTMQGNIAIPESEKLLLEGDDQNTMGGSDPAGHQGGGLHFGHDGKLYVGIGEQTSGAPSQYLDTFLGKILRINSDGSIPKDNPFLDQTEGKYGAIWARGARNPFSFAFRDRDGLMLINDVGGASEEINIGRAGANYGWPVVQHGGQKEYQGDDFDGPIHWYKESSVNGCDFCTTNTNWPKQWQGRYFFADYVQGWIHTLDPDNPKDVNTFVEGMRRPVDMQFAPDGSLYVLLRNAWVMDGKFQNGTGSLLRIQIRGDGVGAASKRQVRTTSGVSLLENTYDPSAGGLPAFKIATASATYFLEKTGGGLSSIVDRDGNDWLGFHPTKNSGAGGEYRGFPNAVYKQEGNYFHPKNESTDAVRTRVEQVADDLVSISVASETGHWAGRYDFFPTFCTFTITAMPEDKTYWALYEGTPGGKLDSTDRWMTSAVDSPQPISKRHEGDIPSPEWITFADTSVDRSIVLLHHEDDKHPDTFYQMDNKMTVFGFGRKGLTAYHAEVGQRFSIGLVESTEHQAISKFANEIAELSDSSLAQVSQSATSLPLTINVWYGLRQRFGHNSNPQRWINILGRLSGNRDSTRLEYSLNGGAKQKLTIGPNTTRLANDGDFNVEIDRSDLNAGENTVVISAADQHSGTTSVTVTIDYTADQSCPLPLHVDWSKAKSIEEVAQVIDGLWKLTPEGIRVVEPYYDRVLAIGDASWTDYEVTVPVTFHGIRRPGPKDGGRNVVHAALAVRWPGHDTGSPPTQPRTKWYPLGATAEFMIQDHPAECRWRIIVDGEKEDFYAKESLKIEFGKQYMLKHQVESQGREKTIYRAKIWEADQPEPKAWAVTGEEENDVAAGGALLLAHYSDLTFGNVTVRPIPTKLGPQPGEVYREYALHNGGDDWRVTDTKATAKRAQAHLPNPVLQLTIDDLQHAVRAEVVLDRWGGHAGTKDKQIRFNGNDWITVPELSTTPPGSEPEQFYSQDNPVVAVSLEDLKEGVNTIEGGIGPGNAGHWWGQWGLYSAILRIYYAPEMKAHASGKIISPVADATLGENPKIKVFCNESVSQIDVLAWYDGYDEDGNGVFAEWHATRFQPLRGEPAALQDHVGTIIPSNGNELIWQTQWVPDQLPAAIKLVAYVHSKNGLIYVTDTVEGLSLRRDGWSVKQYLPTDIPPHFGVRISETKSCTISINPEDDLTIAAEAVLHYRTWEASDEHHNPFQLNGHKHANEGLDHHYDYDLLPIPISELRSGENIFTIQSDTEHHMLEVLWPGPAITVRYRIE